MNDYPAAEMFQKDPSDITRAELEKVMAYLHDTTIPEKPKQHFDVRMATQSDHFHAATMPFAGRAPVSKFRIDGVGAKVPGKFKTRKAKR